MLLNPFNNFYRVPFVSLVMSREQCVQLWARNLERLAHRGDGMYLPSEVCPLKNTTIRRWIRCKFIPAYVDTREG